MQNFSPKFFKRHYSQS